MPTLRTAPHLATLVLLTAFSTLTLNMFLPSLASIAADLDAGYGLVSLSVAGFLLVTGAVQLVLGPLSDRIGRRKTMLAALAVFTAASAGCALAQGIWSFLVFRMLQGGMIAGYALSMAIVRDTSSRQRAASLIGYISMAMAVFPMLGPVAGGVIDALFGWRMIFWFFAVSGGLLFLLCRADLGETLPQAGTGNLPAAAARGLLSEPQFWAYALCSATSTGAFYIFLTGVPLLAGPVFGMDAAAGGLAIGSITAGFMTGSFLSGRLALRLAAETLMTAGRCVACAGLLAGLLLYLGGVQGAYVFFGCTVLCGLGNGLTTPGASAAAMSVRPDLAGSAAGINGALTVAMGALMSTAAGLLITPAGGAVTLLLLMLGASAAGLAAALWAVRMAAGRPQPGLGV